MKVELGDLVTRLRAAGLPESLRVVGHGNRRVLVTLTPRGVLRVHAGYRFAPDPVLAAIAVWARPRVRRSARLAAGRVLAAFPVHGRVASSQFPGPSSQRAERCADPLERARVLRLEQLHREFNQRWFGGSLGVVRLRMSGRMRRRLGEFRPAEGAEPAEIAISGRHLRRHGWRGAADTLLHEMVHQWQAETGRRLGHDREFRRKCAELGIEGRAVCDSASMFWGTRAAPGDSDAPAA